MLLYAKAPLCCIWYLLYPLSLPFLLAIYVSTVNYASGLTLLLYSYVWFCCSLSISWLSTLHGISAEKCWICWLQISYRKRLTLNIIIIMFRKLNRNSTFLFTSIKNHLNTIKLTEWWKHIDEITLDISITFWSDALRKSKILQNWCYTECNYLKMLNNVVIQI